MPEFESVAEVAARSGVPLQDVSAAVLGARSGSDRAS